MNHLIFQAEFPVSLLNGEYGTPDVLEAGILGAG